MTHDTKERETAQLLKRVATVEIDKKGVCAAEPQVDDQPHVVAVVVKADAAGAEDAMMVPPQNANVADFTVESSWWDVGFADGAIVPAHSEVVMSAHCQDARVNGNEFPKVSADVGKTIGYHNQVKYNTNCRCGVQQQHSVQHQ